MRRLNRWLFFFLFGLLILTALAHTLALLPPRLYASQASSTLKIDHSSEQSIVLSLTVDDFDIETVTHAGQSYQRIVIADMVQTNTPGEPQVPTRSTLVGLPSTQGVRVQILSTDYETLHGRYHLYPAPSLNLVSEVDNLLTTTVGLSSLIELPLVEPPHLGQTLDVTDTFPRQQVKLGQVSKIRDQAVAAVHFYPVQYDPLTGEVRLFRHIQAQVTWKRARGEGASNQMRQASPAYETLLRETLLNYDALERPLLQADEYDPITSTPPIFIPKRGDWESGLKIGVTSDGFYQLTYEDLTHGGLELEGVDPRTMKLTNRGTEMAIDVDGEEDGTFDRTDTILFYGRAITDIYTIENVYWLTAGESKGQRISKREGAPIGETTVPPHFPSTQHVEEDNVYWQTMPNGEGEDHWFWQGQFNAPESRDYPFSLTNISTSAISTTLRVRLKGRTNVATNPDHHTKIYLNNVEIDDQQWDGFASYEHQVTVPHSLLNEGQNTLRIESVGDTGADADQLFTNFFEIDYWKRYVAENNQLQFRAPETGSFQFELSGFSSADVPLFEVSDPTNIVMIRTTVLTDGEQYNMEFEDYAQPERHYLALTPAQYKSPAKIEIDQPSSWKEQTNGADYLIITHADFYTATLPLAKHRSQRMRVATIKIEDIYDEFNHGIFNPQAIRDFLSYTYHNWTAPAPTYVLLVGDAVQDYKDNGKRGSVNYVPTQIIETDILGETPSDNWFVQLSGNDILPDMFIGRLSAQTEKQVDDMVAKIISYEQNPPDETWGKKALFVADNGNIFETTSDMLTSLLPADYIANRIDVADYPPGEPTTDITLGINEGHLLINYTGHGSVSEWGTFYNVSNINSLENENKLAVVSTANCLNGFFSGYQTSASLAETFQRLPNKGAIAVWAASNLYYPSAHRALISEFYKALFQQEQHPLGYATTTAKIATYTQNSGWGELIESFILFGDPATPLGGITDTFIPPKSYQIYLPLTTQNN